MSYNQEEVKRFVCDILNAKSIRYEVHDFESGASMIDIWYKEFFYVIQSEKESIGLSIIDEENPGFDTIPDERYFDYELFLKRLNELLS